MFAPGETSRDGSNGILARNYSIKETANSDCEMPRLRDLSNAMDVLLTIIRRSKMQDVHTKARETSKDKREIQDWV